MTLFFDTETTGKLDYKGDERSPSQPDVVQLAAVLMDDTERVVDQINLIINPDDGKPISPEVAAIHGISHELATKVGIPRRTVFSAFNHMAKNALTIVAHNLDFDFMVMLTGFHRIGAAHRLGHLRRVCTMKAATPILRLPKPAGWRGKPKPGDEYKWPTLTECHQHFFGEGFDGAHDAMVDVNALIRVWRELGRIGALDI